MNYYIKGDAAKADQINAAFKKLGYDTSGHIFNANSVLYFTLDGEIRATTCNCTPAIIKTHPDYKELELPKPHYDIANFKPFQKVLVRNDDSYTWEVSFFGRYAGMFMCCSCSNVCFNQCIPFEGNEHLLGTIDPCDERFINW